MKRRSRQASRGPSRPTLPPPPIIPLRTYAIRCALGSIPVVLIAGLMAFGHWTTSSPGPDDAPHPPVEVASPVEKSPSPEAKTIRPEEMVFERGMLARDLAGWVSPNALEHIDSLSKALEAAKGIQLGVLVVPDLGGEDIEGFSLKVARKWALGQKGKDNGILLLLARRDRKLRIEVGRGLEGDLTDLQSHRIIDETIVPFLKRDDVDNALTAGTESIIGIVAPDFPVSHREWAPPTPIEPPPPVSRSERKVTESYPGRGLFLLLMAPLLAFTGWKVVVLARIRWLLLPVAAIGLAALLSAGLAFGIGIFSFFTLILLTGILRGNSRPSDPSPFGIASTSNDVGDSSSSGSSGGGGSFGGGGASGEW